jgi:hypothetical protein
MNRLRDLDGDEPLFQRGVEMVRRTPPAAQAADLKLRVWRSLQLAPVRAPRRFRIWVLKLALVVIVGLAAGTAGAMIARRWIVPSVGGAALPARGSHPAASSRPGPRVEKTNPAEAIAPAAETGTENPTLGMKSPARGAPRRVVVPAPTAASVARERTEVLDALIALRREHDAVRAGTLLARYLSAHPRGAMREEALVLAIEAADARSDRAAGEQLARAYEGEFPAGRFLPFARSHTGGGQPAH